MRPALHRPQSQQMGEISLEKNLYIFSNSAIRYRCRTLNKGCVSRECHFFASCAILLYPVNYVLLFYFVPSCLSS